jgi:hypothetical protein
LRRWSRPPSALAVPCAMATAVRRYGGPPNHSKRNPLSPNPLPQSPNKYHKSACVRMSNPVLLTSCPPPSKTSNASPRPSGTRKRSSCASRPPAAATTPRSRPQPATTTSSALAPPSSTPSTHADRVRPAQIARTVAPPDAANAPASKPATTFRNLPRNIRPSRPSRPNSPRRLRHHTSRPLDARPAPTPSQPNRRPPTPRTPSTTSPPSQPSKPTGYVP